MKGTLGTGTFSRVRLALLDGEPVVLKIMKKDTVYRLKQVEHVKKERDILRQVDHPFIVASLASFQTESELILVNEFCAGGELFSLLRKEGRFPAPKAIFYAAELACALAYLHARHTVFREIKPENFVLDAGGHMRLVDFGFAKVLEGPDDRTFTLCGTPEYLAPEILQHKGHGLHCDWWMFGILISEMLHGYPPFCAEDPMDIYQKILSNKPEFSPLRCDADATDLLQRLLVHDPALRLGHGGSTDVLAHAWFETVDWAAVARREMLPPYVPELKGPTDTSQFDSYPESTEPAQPLPPTDTVLFESW